MDWSNGRRALNFFITDGRGLRFLIYTFNWEFVLWFFNRHPEFWFDKKRHKPLTKKYILDNYRFSNEQKINPEEKLVFKGLWERVDVYEC